MNGCFCFDEIIDETKKVLQNLQSFMKILNFVNDVRLDLLH